MDHLPTAARLGRSCKAQAKAKNVAARNDAAAAAAASAAAAAAAIAAEGEDWSVLMRIEAPAATAAAAVAEKEADERRSQLREQQANDAAAPATAASADTAAAASGISITIPHEVPDAGLASHLARIEEEERRSQLSERVDNPEAVPAAAAEAEVADSMAAMRAHYIEGWQRHVDRHKDAASQPSPWCDMDDTAAVDNPAGSAAFDLLRADIEMLRQYLEVLSHSPDCDAYSAAIHLTMSDIHSALSETVITENIYIHLHSSFQHIVRFCNLLPIFNAGA